MTELAAEYPEQQPERFPCQHCDRHFVKDRLERHEANCCRLSQSSRQPFHSEQQRIKNSDIPPDAVNAEPPSRPTTSWQRQHEETLKQIAQDRDKAKRKRAKSESEDSKQKQA